MVLILYVCAVVFAVRALFISSGWLSCPNSLLELFYPGTGPHVCTLYIGDDHIVSALQFDIT